jgi:mitochondrial fission protein ELM1
VIHKGMPIREILRALKNGRIVGMLSDQDGGRNGTFVDFFNRLSSTPSGVAAFALKTGAPIFPAFVFREGSVKHRIEIEGPLEFPDPSLPPEEAERFLLQQFARILESKIRKAPDQWLWAHRRWKSTPDRTVVILSDGKTGHLNQSLAVLDAIREERRRLALPEERLHVKTIEVAFRSEFRKDLLRAFHFIFRRSPGRLLKAVLTPDCARRIQGAYADIVISCGSSLVDVNLWLKRENQARSLVVMKPSVLDTRHFDAVIAPRHDGLKASENVFLTDGALSAIDARTMEVEAKKLAQELELTDRRRKIGLLVGGDTEALRFEPYAFERILADLERVSAEEAALVLATSSRRTPAWAETLLKNSFGANKRCPLLLIANERNRPGVVGGILGLSDLVMVSAESISMVSEAVESGKRVLVFLPAPKQKLKRKYREFLKGLERADRIALVTADNAYAVLKKEIGRALPAGRQAAPGRNREVLAEAVPRMGL